MPTNILPNNPEKAASSRARYRPLQNVAVSQGPAPTQVRHGSMLLTLRYRVARKYSRTLLVRKRYRGCYAGLIAVDACGVALSGDVLDQTSVAGAKDALGAVAESDL